MAKNVKSNYGRTALIAGATACWLIYDIASATEAPRQSVAVLQYVLLTMALIGAIGSAAMYFSDN
jgi:hypothetical protein